MMFNLINDYWYIVLIDLSLDTHTFMYVCVCWHLIGLKCTCHTESNVLYMRRRDWMAISFACIHLKMASIDKSSMHISDLLPLNDWWCSITWTSLINLPFERDTRRRNLEIENWFNGWLIPEGEASNCLCHSSKTAHSQTNRKERRRRWCLFNYFLINLLIGNVAIVCLRSD